MFGIHTCYASSIVSYIHYNFLLKLIQNSFSNSLCWWFVHVFIFHETIIIWLWLNGYLTSMLKSSASVLFISVTLLDSISQWLYVLFQPISQTIYIFTCTYLALLIFGERSLSEEQKDSSLFESGSAITQEQPFGNLWDQFRC